MGLCKTAGGGIIYGNVKVILTPMVKRESYIHPHCPVITAYLANDPIGLCIVREM